MVSDPVPAQSTLAVYLGNLPADYDLFVFRDVQAAYNALQSPVDPVLETQNNTHGQVAPLQYQPLQYQPLQYQPLQYQPLQYQPLQYHPLQYHPLQYQPLQYQPLQYQPLQYQPLQYQPLQYHPLQYQPLQYQPLQYHPLQYQPLQYQPLAYDETDYGTAQTQTLIGGSALPGTTSEAVIVNSWNSPGDYYIRVAGRDATFSLKQPFSLDVDLLTGECGGLDLGDVRDGSLTADASVNPETLILTDMGRMDGEKAALADRLASLAARREVNGKVIDVGADFRVQDTNALADANPKCPYAKNLVAEAIKRIVDLYRGPNSALHDVVIVGSDHVIPFYRYPDSTPLGTESTYDVPVDSQSPSEASLRNNFALTQDVYGSRVSVSLTASQFPVPDLAVGRLVQTPAEVVFLLDAYLGTPDGVAATPQSSLVTGYSFMTEPAAPGRR